MQRITRKLLIPALLPALYSCAGTMGVLPTGLGNGTVTSSPAGINCGTDCSHDFNSSTTVVLNATYAPGSSFDGWAGDCSGSATSCSVSMDRARRVRARFSVALPTMTVSDLATTASLQTFLTNNPSVNTGPRFLTTLPPEYKENWILMARSESLQTGTGGSPRVLAPNESADKVFSFSMTTHANFPLADPNKVEYMEFNTTTDRFSFHEINLTTRTVEANAPVCQKCHSGRPNWDAYDSWAGMLPFNRDRVYQGTLEAAAFRQLLNPWAKEPGVRQIMEQLDLPLDMTRRSGGAFDATVNYSYEGPSEVILIEADPPAALPTRNVNYFDPPIPSTSVPQGGNRETIHHSTQPGDDEGRGVELFDRLTAMNAQRIAQELVDFPRSPVDIRPIALAINRDCITKANIAADGQVLTAGSRTFLDTRNGMNFTALEADTSVRQHDLPRRKAEIQKLALQEPDGLILAFGNATAAGQTTATPRIRREIFRREPEGFAYDTNVGHMIDREDYGAITTKIALYRYFLEPLGVPVSKWSMGVRSRSLGYNFADLFNVYTFPIRTALENSLGTATDCTSLRTAARSQLQSLPPVNTTPPYAEVQKIFTRHCTECHGGLGYPPYGPGPLDLSPGVSYANARARVTPGNPSLSTLMTRINVSSTSPLLMPYGGPKLPGAEIDTIRRWIMGGANP